VQNLSEVFDTATIFLPSDWEPTKSLWFTSDTHFGHKNILPYDRPQFLPEGWTKDDEVPAESVDAMNEALIKNWNALVGPDDYVVHLGDFAMGQKSAWPSFGERLNGYKILVLGNHDAKREKDDFKVRQDLMLGCGFEEVYQDLYVIHKGVTFWCNHFPSGGEDHEGMNRGFVRPHRDPQHVNPIVLCGHVHSSWRVAPDGCINVGVDAFNLHPVAAETLIELAKSGTK
jgi:calcineurin-like phosphoesterase family protein